MMVIMIRTKEQERIVGSLFPKTDEVMNDRNE